MENFISICAQTETKKDAINFLQKVGLLHTERQCRNGHLMKLEISDKEDRWRCNKAICRERKRLRSGTWLEGTHLSYRQVCLFLYSWSHELTSIAFAKRELRIMSCETTVDWNHYLREVCAEKLMRNSVCIGGEGLHVEIDESLFVRRKYNVGHAVNQQWVFGGICRETHECFIFAVPDRASETLQEIIASWIKPKTTIISDEWRGYRGIESIPERDYRHITVNHSENYVDPKTGACTNTFESMWGKRS
jgi:transposase-like protein